MPPTPASLLADDEAIQARDAVLQAVQSGRATTDPGDLDRLCARAKELRQMADRALTLALTTLHRPLRRTRRRRPGRLVRWGRPRFQIRDLLRTIVELEVHEIRDHLMDAGRAPAR